VVKKEAEKILKYEDIVIEIQCMWSVKARVIWVRTGVTGTISKSLRQYLNSIPGKHERNCNKQLYWALHTYCGKC
jgi:hypothetical protein